MNFISKMLKFLLPILLLAGGVFFVFIFEFYIKDKVNTVSVIVAAEDIPFKGEITEENIKIVDIKRDNLVNGAYYGVEEEHLSKLYGQLAAVEIKKGTQIYESLLDTYDLVPDPSKGEFIAPIPNEWIFAVPGSLRRSYYADFYIVSETQGNDLKGTIQTNNDPNYEGPIETTNEKLSENTYKLNKPILQDVRIAFTKDNANREVRNTTEEGLDATGNISRIEIIATEEMLKEIRKYVDNGYKLYITYNYKQGEE